MQKNEVRPLFIPYTKINSKYFKNLNVRPGTIKLLEENTGEKLHDTGFGNDFSDDKKSTGDKSKNGQME